MSKPASKGLIGSILAAADVLVLLWGIIRAQIEHARRPPKIEPGPRDDQQRVIRDRYRQN